MYGQCAKKDLLYKTVAIDATGQIINSLKVDCFEEFYEILVPLVQREPVSPERMQIDKDEADINEERERKTLTLDLSVTVFNAIGLSWPLPSYEETQRKYFSRVCFLLCSLLLNNNWKIQVAILKSLVQIMKRYITHACTST